MSLSALNDELAQVRTKKKEFLEQIERIVPWGKWVSMIKPCYYKGERGNKPYDLELMLRLYLLQNLYNLPTKRRLPRPSTAAPFRISAAWIPAIRYLTAIRSAAFGISLYTIHCKLELALQELSAGFQQVHCRPFALCKDNNVIRVANPFHAPTLHLPVKLIQIDVCQQRRKRAALRRTFFCFADHTVFHIAHAGRTMTAQPSGSNPPTAVLLMAKQITDTLPYRPGDGQCRLSA